MSFAKFQRRWARDIKTAGESSDYQFNPAEEDNEFYLIFTPQNGLYMDQTHVVHMKLIWGVEPDAHCYPRSPPLCTFKTPIWHPNIGETGIICVDNLKPDAWIATMTLDNVCWNLVLLLLEPNADSPQNTAAGSMLLKDNIAFEKKITEYYLQEDGPNIVKQYMGN